MKWEQTQGKQEHGVKIVQKAQAALAALAVNVMK
jgi:hypothetical protein